MSSLGLQKTFTPLCQLFQMETKISFTTVFLIGVPRPHLKNTTNSGSWDYGDLFLEYRDFVPLEEDCSNIKEALEIFSNSEKCLETVDNCLKSLDQ